MRPLSLFPALIIVLCVAGAVHADRGGQLTPRDGVKALRAQRIADKLATRGPRARSLEALSGQLRAGRHGAARAILELIAHAPSHELRKFAVGSLLDQRSKLTREERLQLGQVVRQVFPRNPPVPATGRIEVRHFIGDEFYRSGIASYRRAGFEIVVHSGKHVTARRGRLHVEIRKGDDDIFRDMGDPKVNVVIFSGHSNVGGVTELSLRTAPEQRGDKLLIGLQCRGAQTMPLVGARFGRAQLITTRHESYDDVDRNLLTAVYDGLERNETYKQIRVRAVKGGKPIANYLFPDSLDSRRRWDLDRDGRLDFDHGRLSDRRFQVPDGGRRAPGHKLLSAVGFLNSTNRYYAEDTPRAKFTLAQVSEALVAGGVAERRGATVTEIARRRLDGRQVFEVKLNPAYGRLPRNTLGAAAIYEMENRMSRSILGSLSTRDRLRALLFAADYVYRLAPTWDEADGAMKWLTKRYNLPRLTYDQLEQVLFTDTKNLGTDKQLDRVERLIADGATGKAAAPVSGGAKR